MINYIDKKNTYIDENVEIGDNCLIYPGVTIMGKTIIGNIQIVLLKILLLEIIQLFILLTL